MFGKLDGKERMGMVLLLELGNSMLLGYWECCGLSFKKGRFDFLGRGFMNRGIWGR